MFISEVVHSALVVMGELAARYSYSEISAKQISQDNNIPQAIIDKAIILLLDKKFIYIKDDQGANTPYTCEAYIYLTKHPDEIYVVDVIKHFNKDSFNGLYVDRNGEVLPQSSLVRCINKLRWRGELFVETQMQGISVNVLATWSNLKKECCY